MPAGAIAPVTIGLIERTDSCSPARKIHAGPLVMIGLLRRPARSASHSQRGPCRATKRDDAGGRPYRGDHQLTGALGQTHVADLESGELADPHAGEHQPLRDRAIAA
jgi:hypothetical protein